MQLSDNAHRAGQAAPETAQMCERPGVTAEAFKIKEQSSAEQPHCRECGGLGQEPANNALAALMARAARAKISLYECGDGSIIVSRQAWGLSRTLPDHRAVSKLL